MGLDDEIEAITADRGLVYTRYADDIAISSGRAFDRGHIAYLLRFIQGAVERAGFKLNDSKTRVYPPGSAKYMLGLLVLEDRVLLPRSFKRQVERAVHGTTKYGVPSYASSTGFVSNLGFVNHVSGKLAYASSVEPEWTAAMNTVWLAAINSGTPV